jgi:histidyl-tRNA synthetase
MANLLSAAPQISAYLGDASSRHFEGLQELLAAAGIEFRINPRLVRGLDYYNLTVFEWITDELGSQGTLCGGGRYDTLLERLGGKPTPAIGFAIGVGRVIECLTQSGHVDTSAETAGDVGHLGGSSATRVVLTAEQVREAGADASLKSQMKRADASGAEFAVIIGEAEMASDSASVKNLRGLEGVARTEQRIVPLHLLADTLVLELSADDQDH